MSPGRFIPVKGTTPKGWISLRFGPLTAVVDPRELPGYRVDLEAIRSDGIVFRWTVGLSKKAIDLLPDPKTAVEAALGAVNRALEDMLEYRDCSCEQGRECSLHGSVQ